MQKEIQNNVKLWDALINQLFKKQNSQINLKAPNLVIEIKIHKPVY
jgi:hypothetical protein